MRVRFYGGCADGKEIVLHEPLLSVYRWPVNFAPDYKVGWPAKPTPRINEAEEYYLIPGQGYYRPDHFEWRRYQAACERFVMDEIAYQQQPHAKWEKHKDSAKETP